jgi:hypothetical protein
MPRPACGTSRGPVWIKSGRSNPDSISVERRCLMLAYGARVLGFDQDTGERYLSVEGLLPTEG